jgi:hypothetical protein
MSKRLSFMYFFFAISVNHDLRPSIVLTVPKPRVTSHGFQTLQGHTRTRLSTISRLTGYYGIGTT